MVLLNKYDKQISFLVTLLTRNIKKNTVKKDKCLKAVYV